MGPKAALRRVAGSTSIQGMAAKAATVVGSSLSAAKKATAEVIDVDSIPAPRSALKTASAPEPILIDVEDMCSQSSRGGTNAVTGSFGKARPVPKGGIWSTPFLSTYSSPWGNGPKPATAGNIRHLIVVLGDQLAEDSTAFQGFSPADGDAVWMAEVKEESTHVWSSKPRTALFLSSMRHFGHLLRHQLKYPVWYIPLPPAAAARSSATGVRNKNPSAINEKVVEDTVVPSSLHAELRRALLDLQPAKVILTEPGDDRVWRSIERAVTDANQELKGKGKRGRSPSPTKGAKESSNTKPAPTGTTTVQLEVRRDDSFFCTREEFATHAQGKKQLRMEFFYRDMRRKHSILMDKRGENPTGGVWNFDEENRESLPHATAGDGEKSGTGNRKRPRQESGSESKLSVPGVPIPAPQAFPPDAITQEVIQLVNHHFADHPGSLENFNWPVTREESIEALDDFIEHRLSNFGKYQDAMWEKQPWLFHSRLSAAMNLKLLSAKLVVQRAEEAFRDKKAPLASVEGFIRQILGWREYVRGIYWLKMPTYLLVNELKAEQKLPAFYWTGDTKMACLKDAISQTLEYGYAHHIQRLMVTGLYSLLIGVNPKLIHEWYLAVYVDAVEWVEAPNTLGMSQFADGGYTASKPYIASGKYIERMCAGTYCSKCQFDPAVRYGPKACPFTTLYWDFIGRHEEMLKKNPRLGFGARQFEKFPAKEKAEIEKWATQIKKNGGEPPVA